MLHVQSVNELCNDDVEIDAKQMHWFNYLEDEQIHPVSHHLDDEYHKREKVWKQIRKECIQ